jgi:hypothetical protein
MGILDMQCLAVSRGSTDWGCYARYRQRGPGHYKGQEEPISLASESCRAPDDGQNSEMSKKLWSPLEQLAQLGSASNSHLELEASSILYCRDNSSLS